MKLEIGAKYENKQDNYTEIIKPQGIEDIDNTELTYGDTIVPRKEDRITVVCMNNISNEWFETTISLKRIAKQFNKIEDN